MSRVVSLHDSLSVGGPVIVPHSKTIAITPVAPHSLNVRPIVICDDWEITLDVESRSHNFLVAVDGRSESCKETTRLTISRADYSIKVVRGNGGDGDGLAVRHNDRAAHT